MTTAPTGRCLLAPVTSRANWDGAAELNVAPVSRRQQAILTFVADYTDKHGYPPSLREIGAAVGLESANSVNYHVHQLADVGLVELSEPSTARAVRLTWGMT